MPFRLYHADRVLPPLPSHHRFPMAKYGLVREQLAYAGVFPPEAFREAPLLPAEEALRVHTPRWWGAVTGLTLSRKEARRLGFPPSPELVERSRRSAMGTLLAARDALRTGLGLNLGGGTHHGFPDHGEGFSVLNDMAIAARHLLAHGLARRILFVDLDVHQGNGNAYIFRQEAAVFTFSVHGQDNYPLHKQLSDLDVALPGGTGDTAYLAALDRHWPALLQRFRPELVFFQSGVDVLAGDRLGHMALSLDGLAARDRRIIEACHQTQTPLVVVMGGGYHRQLATAVDAHAQTFVLASEYFD